MRIVVYTYPLYWGVVGVLLAGVMLIEGLKALYLPICILLAILGIIKFVLEWSVTYVENIQYYNISSFRKTMSFIFQLFKSSMCTCLTISYFSGLNGYLYQSIGEMIPAIIGFVVCLVIFVPDYALTMMKKDASLTRINVCDFIAGLVNGIIFVVGHGNW